MSQSRWYSLFEIHGYSVTKTQVEDLVLYTCVEP